jgi:mono/diheme cytochrome c family protein
MRTALLFASLASLAFGQDKMAAGSKIFQQTCTVGYCHGQGGAAGRAPRLAGRGLDHGYLLRVTSDGIPNTGMPGWKDRIKSGDFEALMEFVYMLNGPSGSVPAHAAAAPKPKAEMTDAAKRGKDLFFDPVRGVQRCGTCHSLEGWGAAVGPNLAASRVSLQSLRNGAGTVRTARTRDGESFPAAEAEPRPGWVRVFDLTSPPPVLRTFPAGFLTWSGNPAWKHEAATASYSDADLAAIAEYLKWLNQ